MKAESYIGLGVGKVCGEKGNSQSGFIQKVRELRLDCDGDSILLIVEQIEPIACHTGRATCFYKLYQDGSWLVTEPVIKDSTDIYS